MLFPVSDKYIMYYIFSNLFINKFTCMNHQFRIQFIINLSKMTDRIPPPFLHSI